MSRPPETEVEQQHPTKTHPSEILYQGINFSHLDVLSTINNLWVIGVMLPIVEIIDV